MLSGDPFEIIVALKDLTAGGFGKLRGEITNTERVANSTNLSGFSRAANAAEKDAAAAAGAEGKGGIGAMASSLVGLAGGPVTLAVAGIAALVGGGILLTKTWDGIERQEKDLDAAFKTNNESLDGNRQGLDALIASGTDYGQGADAVRGAVLELAQAGHKWSDINAQMPTILALAQAKHLDLADAAKQVELAEMGNVKALKDLGVTMPKTTNAAERQTAVLDQLNTRLGTGGGHATAMEKASAKLGNVWQRLASAVGPPLEAMFAAVLDVLGNVLGVVVDVGSALAGPLSVAFNVVMTPVKGLLAVWGLLFEMLKKLLGIIGQVGDAIAHSPIGAFIGGVGNTLGTIGNLIPHFASGGVVEPRPGGQLILAGEAGEREYVVPESRLGSLGGRSTTVHAHLYLDGRELAYAMERPLGALLNNRGTAATSFGGAS